MKDERIDALDVLRGIAILAIFPANLPSFAYPLDLVEATADFVVVQPIDPEKRRGMGIFDVPNRGRRLGLAALNGSGLDLGAAATLDPENPADWGDGFLMEEGLSILWVGWQSDVLEFPGAMRLEVPVARQKDGSKIRGLARSDWVVDAPAERRHDSLDDGAHALVVGESRVGAHEAPALLHVDGAGVDDHDLADRRIVEETLQRTEPQRLVGAAQQTQHVGQGIGCSAFTTLAIGQ